MLNLTALAEKDDYVNTTVRGKLNICFAHGLNFFYAPVAHLGDFSLIETSSQAGLNSTSHVSLHPLIRD